MIISEKQILQLINIAHFASVVSTDENHTKHISKLIYEIIHQQSDKLKKIDDKKIDATCEHQPSHEYLRLNDDFVMQKCKHCGKFY